MATGVPGGLFKKLAYCIDVLHVDMHFVSFGPGNFHYQAFACYDLLNGGNQELDEYGIWTGDE